MFDVLKKSVLYQYIQLLFFSIGGRIFLFFSIIILFLLVSLSLILVQTNRTENYATHIIETELPMYTAFFDLNKQMFQLTSSLRGWMLTKNPIFKVERAAGWKNIEKVAVDIDLLLKQTTHNEYLEDWQKIKKLLPEFKRAQDKVEHTENLAEATTILTTECIPRIHKMLDLLEGPPYPNGQRAGGILGAQRNILKNGANSIIYSINATRITEFLLIGICIMFSVVIAFLISRQIIQPIKTAMNIAKRIAMGERDIAIQIPLNDEIGELLTALREMQTAIKENEAHLLKNVFQLQHITKIASETQHIARLGYWEWDLKNDKFIFSEEILSTLGLNLQGLNFTYNDFLNLIHPDDRKMVDNTIKKSTKHNKNYSIDYRINKSDGSTLYIHGQSRNIYAMGTCPIKVYGILQDITERKLAEENLILLNDQLLAAGRCASVVDVTTHILHNIGNVINSINVSISIIGNKIRTSEVKNLPDLLALLEQHRDDLGRFIAEDKQGQYIPKYLDMLCNALVSDRNDIMAEINGLEKNVNHVKEIISKQQMLGALVGTYEEVFLPDVLEDALSLNKTAYQRAEIDIIRDFKSTKKISTDKIKLLQVVVNLIKNGIDSLLESKTSKKQLKLQIQEKDGSCVMIQINDNGLGISPENLTKIFSSGFTTKKTGHGFGLHASIIAAQEMGGSLSVESKGSGEGATFTLILPYQPASA